MGTRRKRNSTSSRPWAILLDAAGTLIHPAEPVGTVYSRAAAHFGARIDPVAADAAFREILRKTPPPPVRPGPSPDDERGWWQSLVAEVFLRFDSTSRPGFEKTSCFEFLYESYSKGTAWRLFPEVPAFLDRCHAAQFRIAVVSNFDRRLHSIFRDLDIEDAFHAVLVSSEIGAPKPSPRIFQAALNALSASADEAIHVGDDPDADWRGARDAGLHAFPLDRKSHTLNDLWPFLESGRFNPN